MHSFSLQLDTFFRILLPRAPHTNNIARHHGSCILQAVVQVQAQSRAQGRFGSFLAVWSPNKNSWRQYHWKGAKMIWARDWNRHGSEGYPEGQARLGTPYIGALPFWRHIRQPLCQAPLVRTPLFTSLSASSTGKTSQVAVWTVE